LAIGNSRAGAYLCLLRSIAAAAAEHDGVLVCTAVRPSQLSEPAYSSPLAREFSMMGEEDAMNWWVLRPDRATYDFRQGDKMVRFAQAHQMKVRGHGLVWGRYNPDWLATSLRLRQQSWLFLEHIARVMKHYAGRVQPARHRFVAERNSLHRASFSPGP
jgi:endo-1,4-beta-xylanase